jgi:hypothetical protein
MPSHSFAMEPSESPHPSTSTTPATDRILGVDFAAIEDACEKWGRVVSLIAEDAATLRQLSSLLRHLEEGDESALQTLVDLDFVVTNLEQELDEAEEEIKASKQAVLELESISEEADRHLESLRLVQDAFKVGPEDKFMDLSSELRVTTIHGGVLPGVNVPQALIQDPNLQPKSRTTSGTDHLADRNRGASSGGPDPRFPLTLAQAPSTRNVGGDSRSRNGGRRYNAAHVTEDDLKNIPRTTRGHISLSAINDALDQVHTYARRKAARIDRERRTKSQIYRYDSSGRKPPKPSGHGIGGEDEENDGSSAPVLLTEQELRQACAFFRSGEATARSLLLILCAVHRLKQARGGKNGLVYYHILELQQQQHQSAQQSAQNEPEKLQQSDPTTSPKQPSNPLLQRIRRHRQQQQQHVTI